MKPVSKTKSDRSNSEKKSAKYIFALFCWLEFQTEIYN